LHWDTQIIEERLYLGSENNQYNHGQDNEKQAQEEQTSTTPQ
jgi:hypothetical protein